MSGTCTLKFVVWRHARSIILSGRHDVNSLWAGAGVIACAMSAHRREVNHSSANHLQTLKVNQGAPIFSIL